MAYYGVFLINKGCKKNTLLMYSVILGRWMKKDFKEYFMLLRQNYKPNLILQLKYSLIEVNVIIVS